MPQLSTDSVFSREESETIDEYNQEQNEETIPIGIRVKPDDASSVGTTEEQMPPETPSMSSLPDRLVYFIADLFEGISISKLNP